MSHNPDRPVGFEPTRDLTICRLQRAVPYQLGEGRLGLWREEIWMPRMDSNHQHSESESDVLPFAPRGIIAPRTSGTLINVAVVGPQKAKRHERWSCGCIYTEATSGCQHKYRMRKFIDIIVEAATISKFDADIARRRKEKAEAEAEAVERWRNRPTKIDFSKNHEERQVYYSDAVVNYFVSEDEDGSYLCIRDIIALVPLKSAMSTALTLLLRETDARGISVRVKRFYNDEAKLKSFYKSFGFKRSKSIWFPFERTAQD